MRVPARRGSNYELQAEHCANASQLSHAVDKVMQQHKGAVMAMVMVLAEQVIAQVEHLCQDPAPRSLAAAAYQSSAKRAHTCTAALPVTQHTPKVKQARRMTHQRPIASPNSWLISGEVVKSPFAPRICGDTPHITKQTSTFTLSERTHVLLRGVVAV
jgi:hypothetical protein